MRCVEIDPETGKILNFVVATPDGDVFLEVPEGLSLNKRDHFWDGKDFILTPEAQARVDAELVLIEQEAWSNG